jgi:hypothetical protein
VNAEINKCKIKYWKWRSKTELTERIPLRRRRSALDCSAMHKEQKEEEEELLCSL